MIGGEYFMKYFFIRITTQYDGMEWTEKTVISARNEEIATRKVLKIDWTHGDGIETQELGTIQEITRAEYDVLLKFI
jgi:hypothetical protein